MKTKLVFHTVGRVLLLEAALMLLPLIVSIIYAEGCLTAFIISAACAAIAGGLLTTLCRSDSKSLYTRDGLAIVALSWIGISLFGALPFVISGQIPSFVDAFFETVSGFTTTGASILKDVETLSHGILFWRSFTHWVGGMGVLVFIMAVMEKTPERSVNILRAEMPGHNVDKLTPRASGTAKILYYIYLAMTLLETLLLLCGGMPLFDSIVHALGTAGTGGFGVKADSIASYSCFCQWVITVFMLLFGVSFNMYYLLLIKKWREVLKSNELKYYFGISLAAIIIIAVIIFPVYESVSDALRLSAFQVSSILTTTGYATADFDKWPQLAKAVLLLLMFFGGCMGSTAGGLKMSRVVVLMQIARNDLRRALRPREVSSVILNGRRVDAHRIGAAVHAIDGRHPQNAQPQPGHAAQNALVGKVRAGGQRIQRHAASQRLPAHLKQPVFDFCTLAQIAPALQKYIFFTVRKKGLHHAHAGQVAHAVPPQRQIAVAPDGHDPVTHYL